MNNHTFGHCSEEFKLLKHEREKLNYQDKKKIQGQTLCKSHQATWRVFSMRNGKAAKW